MSIRMGKNDKKKNYFPPNFGTLKKLGEEFKFVFRFIFFSPDTLNFVDFDRVFGIVIKKYCIMVNHKE